MDCRCNNAEKSTHTHIPALYSQWISIFDNCFAFFLVRLSLFHLSGCRLFFSMLHSQATIFPYSSFIFNFVDAAAIIVVIYSIFQLGTLVAFKVFVRLSFAILPISSRCYLMSFRLSTCTFVVTHIVDSSQQSVGNGNSVRSKHLPMNRVPMLITSHTNIICIDLIWNR